MRSNVPQDERECSISRRSEVAQRIKSTVILRYQSPIKSNIEMSNDPIVIISDEKDTCGCNPLSEQTYIPESVAPSLDTVRATGQLTEAVESNVPAGGSSISMLTPDF